MEEVPRLSIIQALIRRHVVEGQRGISRMHARSIRLRADILRVRNMYMRTVRWHASRDLRRLLRSRYHNWRLSQRIQGTSLSSPPIQPV